MVDWEWNKLNMSIIMKEGGLKIRFWWAKSILRALFDCLSSQGWCTKIWDKQESRHKYWATCSSIRSFARTAHWVACSALLISLTPLLEGKWMIGCLKMPWFCSIVWWRQEGSRFQCGKCYGESTFGGNFVCPLFLVSERRQRWEISLVVAQ